MERALWFSLGMALGAAEIGFILFISHLASSACR